MKPSMKLFLRGASLAAAVSLIAACGDITRPSDNTGTGAEGQPTVVLTEPATATVPAAPPTEVSSGTPAPAAQPIPALPAGIEFVTMPSGLKYADIEVGTGEEAKTGQTVAMYYTGYLADGTVFDGNVGSGQPLTTPIGAGMVIQGWDQGIPGMKVGGKRRLIIPAELGYGANGYPPVIPPNAELTFDVQLDGISK